MRCFETSRRSLLLGGGAVAAAMGTGVGHARVSPQQMVPLIGPGYRPVDADEKGMWQQMERVEEEIAGSNLLIKDPRLTSYLQDIIGSVGGPAAKDMRIYLARVPDFNAMMFPTGFTVFFSGLLLRMRNEAQLAGVVAHESAHFLRKHQIRSWRDMKRKSDLFALGQLALGGLAGATGANVGDIAQLAELGTILSLLRYSRVMEAEADAMGARLLAEQGYPAVEMATTWQQLIGEQDASARYRRKRRERRFSLFETHPSPESRMTDLKISAAEVTVPGRSYENRRTRYMQAIGPIRQMLLDDQVKLNDPGASLYLIQTLAQDGWDGTLRFHEAEIWRLRNRAGDDQRAAQGYATAVLYPDAPADAWRWHGLSLMKQGQPAAGKAALQRYLQMAPNAPDAPFIRQMAA